MKSHVTYEKYLFINIQSMLELHLELMNPQSLKQNGF